MTAKRLSKLEHTVMDLVWAKPGCTVNNCHDALAAERPMKENTVRTLLQRLEKKGYVRHEADGRTYRYYPIKQRQNIAAGAVKQIIDSFCGGSLEALLVGMVENDVVDRRELAELAGKIARRKK